MNSCELVTLISVLSCAIAKGKTINEINLLSVIFSQIGDSLATIAVVQSNNNNTTNDNTSC